MQVTNAHFTKPSSQVSEGFPQDHLKDLEKTFKGFGSYAIIEQSSLAYIGEKANWTLAKVIMSGVSF